MEETTEHGILGRHQSCSEERIEVLSNTIDRNHPLRCTPACCIPKVVRMETGKVIYEKVYASPRLPPKISLKHDWMKELGSEGAQRPEGQVVQQPKSSQLNQPNPNPNHDRTGQPVVGSDPRPRKVDEKLSVLKRSKDVLFMKKLLNMIQRGHPLFAVTQVARKVQEKHVHLMTARASTLKINRT